MVTIRTARDGDVQAVRRVVAAAFSSDGDRVAGLVDALDASGATAVSLVACADDADRDSSGNSGDGDIVGHVQLSRSWIDAPRALVDVLVLSPLSVVPARQRQGIGAALTRAALDAALGLGVPAVFLEGDPGYYRQLGFEPGRPLGFEAPSVRIPDPAFQVSVLDGYETWMTGRLVYCDAFWATDCVGLREETDPSGATPVTSA